MPRVARYVLSHGILFIYALLYCVTEAAELLVLFINKLLITIIISI